MNVTIEILKKKYRAYRESNYDSKLPISSYIDRSYTAFNLVKKCHERIKTPLLLKAVYNNYIVNLVSAMEVYFRDVVIDGEKWTESGYTNLLKDKIPLSEAFSLFGSEPVTRQYIVAQTSSFKNFESIGQVFSNLTDTDFYKEIENHLIEWENEDNKIENEALIKSQPNWRKDIIELFEVRNQYVHDGAVRKLGMSHINELSILTWEFIIAIDEYLDSKFRPPRP